MSGSLGTIRELPPPEPVYEATTIDLETDDPDAVTIDPGTGALMVEGDDGSVVIDFGGPRKTGMPQTGFADNLAMALDDGELAKIADQLLTEIDADERSRQSWLDTRTIGLDMLGLKLEDPRGDVGASSAPLEGMSTVRSPLLLEACLRFQANARGELLPAAGPVKVVDNSTNGGVERDELAEALEQDLNTYLTQVASEYYPDTDRMLFYTGFGGSGFKKGYHCPLRRRPVIESVDAEDLIVDSGATDLRNAQRITHRIKMRSSMVRRLQLAGVYRDVPLTPPSFQPTVVDEKQAELEGREPKPQLPQDERHTIYECYCELEIAGLNDGPSGLPVPYRVTIDKDSRQVLDIRRNWAEDDPMFMPKVRFVRYPFVEAEGIYCIGLLQILGNTVRALTAATREMLDAGMFASFPGFLYSEVASRQETNQFRVPPGGGQKVQTGGAPIGQVVMPLPYKGPDAALLALAQHLEEGGQRLGATAELQVGEGRQDAPVGTTMAMIDQATKLLDAVHKRLHAAQAEEFRMLRDLLREDPEALWKHKPNGWALKDQQEFLQALNDYELSPAADPNVPTHTHRLMKCVAIKQMQAASPQLYDPKAVDTYCLKMIGVSNPDTLFAPPMPPGAMAPAQPQIDPNKAMQTQTTTALKMAELRQKAASDLIEAQERAKDRQSREQIAAENDHMEKLRLGVEMAKHPEAMATLGGLLGAGSPPPAPAMNGAAP